MVTYMLTAVRVPARPHKFHCKCIYKWATCRGRRRCPCCWTDFSVIGLKTALRGIDFDRWDDDAGLQGKGKERM